MANVACDVYDSSGDRWPVRCLPATAFPRGSAARDRDAAKAWAFFERVEAYDAEVRYQLAGTGWIPRSGGCAGPNPWYQFASASEATLYRRGQLLHIQLCPGRNWTSQRNLGIPSEPITDVYPAECPNYDPPITDPLSLFLMGTSGTRSIASSPMISATQKSLHGISNLNQTPNNSSNNSSQKGSRRASVSH